MTRSALFLFTALSLALHLLLFLALPQREDSTVLPPAPLRVGLVREWVEDTATATQKRVSSAASAASAPSRTQNSPIEPPQPPDDPTPPQEKTPLPRVEPPPPAAVETDPLPQKSVAREEPMPIQESIPDTQPPPEEKIKTVQEQESLSDTEPQEGPAQAQSAPPGEEESPMSLPSEAVSGGAELVQAAPDYALNPPPHYPQAARTRGWEGTVTVRVHVSAAGRAESVTLEESSGYSLLDRSALKAVRRWRFRPALLGEKAVESDVLVPVIFKMRDS